jgi:hypothetical protein
MSRKALFANLKPASASAAEVAAIDDSENRAADDKPPVDPVRTARLRSRPILGAPELIRTTAAPVGALGQSRSEFKAQSERALAIERQQQSRRQPVFEWRGESGVPLKLRTIDKNRRRNSYGRFPVFVDPDTDL